MLVGKKKLIKEECSGWKKVLGGKKSVFGGSSPINFILPKFSPYITFFLYQFYPPTIKIILTQHFVFILWSAGPTPGYVKRLDILDSLRLLLPIDCIV